MARGRLVVLGGLGVLIALAVGAIILSLVTAPPIADSHLRTAAGNTAAAKSFRIDLSVSSGAVGAAPSSTQRVSAVILYQAPNRTLTVERASTTETVTQLVVGGRAWLSEDGGSTWRRLPVPATIGAADARTFVRPLQALQNVSGVRQSGDIYTLLTLDRGLPNAYGVGEGASVVLSSLRATISGEFMRTIDVAFRAPGSTETARVVEVFSLVDKVADIVPPAASRVLG